MNKQFIKGGLAVFVAASFAASAVAQQEVVVYDNTSTNLGQFVSNVGEVGDEFRPSGTARTMTRFDFQTFSGNLDGDEQLTLRFYEITNPSASNFQVGNLLYQHSPISVQNGNQVHIITGLNVNLAPVNLWTIEVSNLDAGDVAGLVVFDGPSVGASFDDFVIEQNGTFELATLALNGAGANFAARVTAVPEPATVALGALGLVAMLGLRRRK